MPENSDIKKKYNVVGKISENKYFKYKIRAVEVLEGNGFDHRNHWGF